MKRPRAAQIESIMPCVHEQPVSLLGRLLGPARIDVR
jgi:hypothetical protein